MDAVIHGLESSKQDSESTGLKIWAPTGPDTASAVE